MILVLGATKRNIKEEKVLPAVVQDVTCFCPWNFLVCLFQTQKIKTQSSPHPPPLPEYSLYTKLFVFRDGATRQVGIHLPPA